MRPIIGAVTTLGHAVLRPIRLTELTDCGGCAAKLGADLLADALSGLGAEASPEPAALIAGLHPPDDAAAYRISDELAIIGTLDFFPPLVDDARTFGEIAAANALSDVFAMGGRVLFALSIAAFPEELPRDVLAADLRGRHGEGARGRRNARRRAHDPRPGAEVRAGGHRRRPIRIGCCARAARGPGDVLLLTKRLGTGVLVSGAPAGRARRQADLAAAIDQMRALNRAASEVLVAHGVAAATDVTGFGLLGHGLEMARASGARFVFDAAALPALPGALELARGRGRDRWRRPTTAGSSLRRSSVADGCAAGARDARPRPADLRWAARRGRRRIASRTSDPSWRLPAWSMEHRPGRGGRPGRRAPLRVRSGGSGPYR